MHDPLSCIIFTMIDNQLVTLVVRDETDLFIIYDIFLLWILRGHFDGWDPMEFYAFNSHIFIFFQRLPQVT